MPDWNKPMPTMSGETRPYWEAARRGQLLIQRCDACNEYQFYPRGVCVACFTPNIKWVPASGKGAVWTFTVTRQNRAPGFAEDVPYVLALVELDEGVKMFTNIIDCPPQDVHIGMPLEVTFRPASDTMSVPYFRPIASG